MTWPSNALPVSIRSHLRYYYKIQRHKKIQSALTRKIWHSEWQCPKTKSTKPFEYRHFFAKLIMHTNVLVINFIYESIFLSTQWYRTENTFNISWILTRGNALHISVQLMVFICFSVCTIYVIFWGSLFGKSSVSAKYLKRTVLGHVGASGQRAKPICYRTNWLGRDRKAK